MSEDDLLERIARLERVVSHLGVALEKLSQWAGRPIMGAAAADMPELYATVEQWVEDVTGVCDDAKAFRGEIARQREIATK